MVILLRFNQPVRPADVAPHIAARLAAARLGPAAAHAGGTVAAEDGRSRRRHSASTRRWRPPAPSRSRPRRSRFGSPPTGTRNSFRRRAIWSSSKRRRRSRPRRGCGSRSCRRFRRRPARRSRAPRRSTSSRWSAPSSSTDSTARGPARPTSATASIFRGLVDAKAYASAVQAAQVDGGQAGSCRWRSSRFHVRGPSCALDEAPEFLARGRRLRRQPPAQTFSITIDGSLRSADGQTLGYTWAGSVENWHERAFTSFGDGHGVWERSGGTQLPFYARNIRGITQWSQRVPLPELVPTIVRLQRGPRRAGSAVQRLAPPSPAQTRRLNVTPDRIQSHGIDLSPALGSVRHRPGVGGDPRRRSDRTRGPAVRQGRRPRPVRRSSRSRTSGSRSRTARRTRSSSSPGSTPAHRCRPRRSPSSTPRTRRCGAGPPAPTASPSPRKRLPSATRTAGDAVVRRHRREGRRRRLRRQRLERRDLAVGVRRRTST